MRFGSGKLRSLWQGQTAQRDRACVPSAPLWQRFFIVPTSIANAVIQDFLQGQLTLRAMSLVYTSVLSMVPMIAISFSVLKAFGVHNRIEPFLKEALKPLGRGGAPGNFAARDPAFAINARVNDWAMGAW